MQPTSLCGLLFPNSLKHFSTFAAVQRIRFSTLGRLSRQVRVPFLFLILWMVGSSAFSQTPPDPSQRPDLVREALNIEFLDAGVPVRARWEAMSVGDEWATGETALVAGHLFHGDGEPRMRRFLKDNPKHPLRTPILLALGDRAIRKKEYQKALADYEGVDPELLSEKDRKRWTFQRGYAAFLTKDFETARPLLNQSKKEESPYKLAAAYYAGYANFQTENYDEALSDFRSVETNEGYAPLVPYMILHTLNRQGKFAEMIPYGEKALAEQGDKLHNKQDVNQLIGEAYFQQQNYAKAAGYYAKAPYKKPPEDPGYAYRFAFAHFQIDSILAAKDGFEQVALKKDTLGQYAAYYLGQCYLKLGDVASARLALDRAAAESYSKEVQASALLDVAKLAYQESDYTTALRALDRFEAEYPKHARIAEARSLHAETLLRSRNYPAVLDYVDAQGGPGNEKLRPIYRQAAYLQGITLFNENRAAEGLTYLRKAKETSVNWDEKASVVFWEAESYSALGQWQKAGEGYRSVSSNEEFGPRARYGLGYTLYNQGKYKEAKEQLSQAINGLEVGDRYRVDARFRLAECDYALRDYNAALSGLNALLAEAKPDRPNRLRYRKAQVLARMGRYDEAQKELDRLLDNPRDGLQFEGYYLKADLALTQGNFAAAEQGFSRLIDLNPPAPWPAKSHLQRGTARYNQTRIDAAVEDYAAALRLGCRDSLLARDALESISLALTNSGRPDEVAPYLTQFSKCHPNEPLVQRKAFEIAYGAFDRFEYTKAIPLLQDYRKTYGMESEAVSVTYALAESAFNAKSMPMAKTEFRRLLDLGTADHRERSHYRLAQIAALEGDTATAIKEYKALLDPPARDRWRSDALTFLSEASFAWHDNVAARDYANQIIALPELRPDAHDRARILIGRTYQMAGEDQKAEDRFLQVMNNRRDALGAEAQYHLAEIRLSQGKTQQSLDLLMDLIQNFESKHEWVGEAYLLAAECYLAKREPFQAKAILQSLIDGYPEPRIVDKAKIRLRVLEESEANQTAAPR